VLCSSLHALLFAGVTGTVGTTLLAMGANPLTATLGVFNLGLYTAIYTPMKRLSIVNTWVGSVVGAIPPMMGWVASCGTLHAGRYLRYRYLHITNSICIVVHCTHLTKQILEGDNV